ncbi:flagellar type III secretion system protein FliR [Lederbergia sp. NSJ-179]|uniref:flagellar biosynthetic protein FliR n=1 Tax=Lederbergia sp. NSJ-179 TaxID=2931402 RepID=UPI001FD1046F|nr:flagellar biosynthetic protein FliR [Lederbergia sp. NSJ-179]MCJ7839654.1 flagellar type III secretion system protein FliR [Lederbergia sp. NSJ-179]
MESLIPHFSIFLLVFMRISAFFVSVPLFSYRTIPTIFKIGFSFILALLVYYTLDISPLAIDGVYLLLIVKEAIVGLFLGFIAYMMLSAIQIAGGFIDFQMGFAIANVIDPQTGAQSPLMGQYFYMFALLFLLAVNGHHFIIDGIFNSYHFIPIDHFVMAFGQESFLLYVIKSFGLMFMIAFQMAIPIVASLFLVDVALGIVGRTVPQLNIFVVGFPIKIAVSFIVLFIVMALLFAVIQNLFEEMLVVLRDVMSFMGGTG